MTPDAQHSPDAPTLRVAVPNKGSLSQAAADVLREAGYPQRNDPKQLSLTDPVNPNQASRSFTASPRCR